MDSSHHLVGDQQHAVQGERTPNDEVADQRRNIFKYLEKKFVEVSLRLSRAYLPKINLNSCLKDPKKDRKIQS